MREHQICMCHMISPTQICDLCDMWYHIGCEHISVSEYELWKHENQKAPRFCRLCINRFKHLKNESETISEENTEFSNENDELKDLVKRLGSA